LLGWILTDGRDNKPSTNGTWLYIGEEQTIYNGMIFKASQTLFQVKIFSFEFFSLDFHRLLLHNFEQKFHKKFLYK